MPAQRIGEHAAEEHADASAARHDEAEKAHGPRPVAGFGEERHDQRQRHGRHDRPAQALHCAGDDQHRLRHRQPAGERRQREQRDADQKKPALAVKVAEPAAKEQEAAEGQHVGIDHPDQRRLGEAEVDADRWQRDIHDGRVEDDHQVAEAEHHQGEPAGTVVRALVTVVS